MYQALDNTLQDQLLRNRHLSVDFSVVGATATSAVVSQVNVPGLLVLGTEANFSAVSGLDSAVSAITGFASNTAGEFIGVMPLSGKDNIAAVVGCDLYINGLAPTGSATRCDAQLSASGNILLRMRAVGTDLSVAATSNMGIVVHYRINP